MSGERPGAQGPACRACRADLPEPFLDLGAQPLSNAFLFPDEIKAGAERAYPLRVRRCPRCSLVQTDDAVPPEHIFNAEYAYYSSYSDSWLDHSRRFASAAVERFHLDQSSRVIEVASNDGYLLQYFLSHGVPVLGVEPAGGAAAAARARGVTTDESFFNEATGRRLRAQGLTADLAHGANVLAHVPDIGDFLAGFPHILRPGGVLTLEFPHLLELMEKTQFDTIYHEHFSYLSLLAVERALAAQGLAIFDLDRLPTHGGSLRIYCGRSHETGEPSQSVLAVRRAEMDGGLDRADTFAQFSRSVAAIRANTLAFFAQAGAEGRRIAAYGAAAKGNTFLNTCGLSAGDILCAFDRNPHKQGRLLPGSHVPVVSPDDISSVRPDYVLILPWNLRDEVKAQLAGIAAWGGRFVTAIPAIDVFDP